MFFNKVVLMSGVEWFDDAAAINPFMDESIVIDRTAAKREHDSIRLAFESASIQVIRVPAPENCQDGVYTANWALVRGDKAVLARLPNARTAEEPYAEKVLSDLGKQVIRVPGELRFSGQGDALPCGNYLFTGIAYRSDDAAQQFAADTLGYDRVALRTLPLLNPAGRPCLNASSGWTDSYFYDVDLALSVLRQPTGSQKGLIAWCPDAFTAESRAILQAFDGVDKIVVSLEEAKEAFACNLVSTGDAVIMSANAPVFTAELQRCGFTVYTPMVSELAKGGGYIRCTSLTLE